MWILWTLDLGCGGLSHGTSLRSPHPKSVLYTTYDTPSQCDHWLVHNFWNHLNQSVIIDPMYCSQNTIFEFNIYILISFILYFTLLQGVPQITMESTLCCEAQGKERAQGRLRKVTQRSFIDYRLQIIDILTLELTLNFVATHYHPPYFSLSPGLSQLLAR